MTYYYYTLGPGPNSPCERIVEGEEQCGLLHGHTGDHTPYLIGGYLRPPTLHPLDLLPILTNSVFALRFLRCPLCGTRATEGIEWDAPFTVFHDGSWNAAAEVVWTFQPCGCEGRELLPTSRRIHIPHRDTASLT